MEFQQTPSAVPLLLAAAIAASLAVYAVRRRREGRVTATAVPFAAMSVAGALWACAYGLQLASADLAAKAFWSRFVWIGAVAAPTAWLVFVVAFTGREKWLTRPRLALLAVEPAIALGLAWTAGSSDLFVADVAVNRMDGLVRLSIEPGVAFLGHLAYSYGLNLVSFALLARVVLTSRGLYRRQAGVLLGSQVVVVLAGLASISGLAPAGLDLTPLSFAAVTPLGGWALFRYRLLEIVPVARDKAIEEMRDPIVVVDRERRVTDSNPAARKLLPVDGQLLGRPITGVLPEAADLLDDPDGDGSGHEVTIRDGDDQRIFSVSASPMGGTSDGAIGSLVALREVTERRHAERRFRALIENASDLITVHDPDGTVTYCSPSVEGLLGYEPADFVGVSDFRIVHPEDREAVRDAMSRLVEQDSARVEFRIRREDGAWRTFEGIGTNLLDDPAVGGLVFNSRDVTRRREYEQRLGVLTRVLRHDLRNALTVVLGNLEFLTDDLSDEESLARAEAIREQARKLEALSEKARHVDHRMADADDRRERIDLPEVVAERVAELRDSYPAAEVEATIPDGRPVTADPLLDSAVEYVLENAVVHNDRAEPTVEVALSRTVEDGVAYVDVRIADDGPGLPPGEREVLLEGVEGPLAHTSGLGLWLVNWIVGRSEGEVRLDDNEPRGTVVTLRLPASDGGAGDDGAGDDAAGDDAAGGRPLDSEAS